MNNSLLLEVDALSKNYVQGGETLSILRDLSLSIARGEMVGLIGPSGSGKSTLLHMLGLLDTPTSGRITLDGHDMSRASEQKRTALRRDTIGFVYQSHYLQPEFSAAENVAMPLLIAGIPGREAKAKAVAVLEKLGLGHRLDHRPARLSGGEQQRVSIGRALVAGPKLLLADEPTGNLDPSTSEEVFAMMVALVRDTGVGALVATHNLNLASQMDRVLELRQGQLFARERKAASPGPAQATVGF